MSFTYNQLIKQYPRLFKNTNTKIYCNVGWFNLINILLERIDSYCVINDIEVDVLQVKEKFGGLRFYINNKSNDQYLKGLVSMAESMSFYICEYCGNEGSPTKGKWIKTKCKECIKNT